MGNTYKAQGKLEEAIDAYQKALSIKPDYAEAQNNIANALQAKWRLEEAIQAYTKALSIKPDYAEAHSNMGNTLHKQGKLKDAIEAYKKALSIKPDYAEAWNNLYFTLQAMKAQINSDEELSTFYPKDYGSNYAKRALCILRYKLLSTSENYDVYLENALKSLSIIDNITIQNPISDRPSRDKLHGSVDK